MNQDPPDVTRRQSVHTARSSGSPMLFKISKGSVTTYSEGQEPLVYLVTTLPRLTAAGRPLVISDGNCASSLTSFSDDPEDVSDLVDWDVMSARICSGVP